MRGSLATGLVCIGIGAGAFGALQLTLEPRSAGVQVRWAPAVDEATRRISEERYGLSHGALREGRTWSYTLDDTSIGTIRALVGDPDVEDTGEIDRTRFRVSRQAMRGHPSRSSKPSVSVTLRIVAVLGWLIGLSCVCLWLAERASPGVMARRDLAREPNVGRLLRRQRALVLVLLGSMLVLGVGSMRRLTATADEPQHLLYGQNILRLDSNRFDDSKMPISTLNALPSALAAHWPRGTLATFLARPETSRYATMAFSILTALCVFAWARRLYGADAGLLALTLYAFDPNLLAHAQLTTTDLYAAGTTTMALYAFWRFLHVGGWSLALASGLLLGLAQIAKYTAIVLYPLLAMIAIAFHFDAMRRMVRERRWELVRRRLVAGSGIALASVLLSLTIINVGFLFNQSLTPLDLYSLHSSFFRSIQSAVGVAGELPLPIPYPYLEGLDLVMEHERTGSSFGRIYLFGELREGSGFLGYYLWASLFKVPLATQCLVLGAGVAFLARRRRLDWRKNEVVMLLPVAFFTAYFNVFNRSQIGIRYFLVVFPLAYVFAGSLMAIGTARARASVGAVAVGGLILSVVSYYPHFLPYFNELVWDRTQAYTILADSNIDWGQNGSYVAEYQARHPDHVFEPEKPTAGTILVRVNQLTAVTGDPNRYRWLREHFKPIDHVAHAVLVYRVTETDLERIGYQP